MKGGRGELDLSPLPVRIAVTDQPSPDRNSLTENDIHKAIGSEGIGRLVRAFYQQVPQDDVLGPMYPAEDLHGAEDRLRLFLIFRFGGPQDYLQHRGHPKLRIRHAPFAIDQRARDRWVSLMENAIQECKFGTEVSQVIRVFVGNVAGFLVNYPGKAH
jgi:hemoglobin